MRHSLRHLSVLLVVLAQLLLGATAALAQSQAPIAWWLGTNPAVGDARARSSADAGAAATAWWLGGDDAARQATRQQGAVAQSVSWWLGGGSGQEGPAAPETTLPWWLGTQAQAQDQVPLAEIQPPAPEPEKGPEPPDYAAWEGVASAAEAQLDEPGVSNFTLERMRATIVEWREKFLTAQNANGTRIKTIRDQISALGPAPAEGESEAEEIAARRAQLNDQLAKLQAPGIAAEEAYRRADGLIREVDTILRDRQADELVQLGPSPLVPQNWVVALGAVTDLTGRVWSETSDNLQSTITRSNARENLPVTITLLVLSIALIWKGRDWTARLTRRALSGQGRRSRRAALALLVSVGQLVLPLVGLVLFVSALFTTGFVGPIGGVILQTLPTIGATVLAARWLGQQTFSEADEVALLKSLPHERRAEGRFYATAFGLLIGAAALIGALLPFEGDTMVARAVLNFPIVVAAGILLTRLGQILAQAGKSTGDETGGEAMRSRVLGTMGRLAMLLGVAGPVLAAVGYFMAARYLTFPTVVSLALFAFLAVLRHLAADLYAWATGRGDEEEEALIPVLIGFGLTVISLPLLALIWGARVSDLTELWNRAREGFSIGETRIAPTDFLVFVAVFAIGYVATRLLQSALKTSVLPKTTIDPGGQNAIVSGTGYLGVFLAAVIAITTAGIDLSSLAIVAGALSVGIGFGLQNIVSNFISGIILLIERPISEGDWIDVNGQMGTVRAISVRSTRIETFDRTDVIVPNSDLISGVVTNYTRGNLLGRIILKVGVAYGTDTRRVEEILKEIAEAHPMVTVKPPPSVLFMGFGADSLDFEIRAILRDVNYGMSTRSELNHEIARRFAEEGIEIPFAQRDIWLRNPEALTGAGPKPPKKPKKAQEKQASAPGSTPPVDPSLREIPEPDDEQ